MPTLLFANDPEQVTTPGLMIGGVSVGAVIVVGYGLVRLWAYYRGKRLTVRTADEEAATSKRDQDRRSAADEAWALVQRLQLQIAGNDDKVRLIEEKCDRAVKRAEEREREALERDVECGRELAGVRAQLDIVVAWARSRGVKIPEFRSLKGDKGEGVVSPHGPPPAAAERVEDGEDEK